MIKFYYPGKHVPEWLETVTPRPGLEHVFVKGTLKFCSFGYVAKRDGYFHCHNIIGPEHRTIKIGGGMSNANIQGQGNGNGVLHHHPIISYDALLIFIGVLAIINI